MRLAASLKLWRCVSSLLRMFTLNHWLILRLKVRCLLCFLHPTSSEPLPWWYCPLPSDRSRTSWHLAGASIRGSTCHNILQDIVIFNLEHSQPMRRRIQLSKWENNWVDKSTSEIPGFPRCYLWTSRPSALDHKELVLSICRFWKVSCRDQVRMYAWSKLQGNHMGRMRSC